MEVEETAAMHPTTSPVQLRVAKGFGTKPYGTLRVSVVTPKAGRVNSTGFDYCDQFQYKWKDNHLCSTVIEAAPGANLPFSAGGLEEELWLPAQGAGVAGVLIADPCVAASKVGCTFASRFQTTTRTPALLNAFVGRDSDYWGIFGDNFYDQDGSITAQAAATSLLPVLPQCTRV